MNSLKASSWIKLPLPFGIGAVFPISPNFVFEVNSERKECRLIKAAFEPTFRSLGNFSEDFQDIDFNEETLVLTLLDASLYQNGQPVSKYLVDIPRHHSFQNARLIKMDLSSKDDEKKMQIIRNRQKAPDCSFGSFQSYGAYSDNGEEFGTLDKSIVDFIQKSKVAENQWVYADGDLLLFPERSGQDAFYSGLILHEKKKAIRNIPLPGNMPYVECERAQGIIFNVEGDDGAATDVKPKSAIYFCSDQDDETLFFYGISPDDDDDA